MQVKTATVMGNGSVQMETRLESKPRFPGGQMLGQVHIAVLSKVSICPVTSRSYWTCAGPKLPTACYSHDQFLIHVLKQV